MLLSSFSSPQFFAANTTFESYASKFSVVFDNLFKAKHYNDVVFSKVIISVYIVVSDSITRCRIINIDILDKQKLMKNFIVLLAVHNTKFYLKKGLSKQKFSIWKVT